MVFGRWQVSNSLDNSSEHSSPLTHYNLNCLEFNSKKYLILEKAVIFFAALQKTFIILGSLHTQR